MTDIIKYVTEQDIENRLNKGAFITKDVLRELIRKGETKLVKIVIQEQRIVDSEDYQSELDSYFVKTAIEQEKFDIAQALLEAGVPISKKDLYKLINLGKKNLIDIVIKKPKIVDSYGYQSELDSYFVKTAIEQEKFDIVQTLLEAGVLIIKEDIHKLIKKGKKDLIDIVIKKQKMISSSDYFYKTNSNFIEIAVVNKQFDTAKHMLSAGAHINRPTLSDLIKLGKKDLIDIVIKKPKIVDSYGRQSELDSYFVKTAIEQEKFDITQALLEAGVPIRHEDLHKLIEKGKKDLVEIFINKKQKIADKSGNLSSLSEFLETAILNYQFAIAELLKDKGVKLNYRSLHNIINTQSTPPLDSFALTMNLSDDCLIDVMIRGNLAAFNLILNSKQPTIDFNMLKYTVMYGGHNGGHKIIDYVIDNNLADLINMVDEDDNNLLCYVRRNPEMVEKLVNHGINLNQKNKHGKTPFDYMIKHYMYDDDIDMLKKMIDLGAKGDISQYKYYSYEGAKHNPILSYYKALHYSNAQEQQQAIKKIAQYVYDELKYKKENIHGYDFEKFLLNYVSALSKEELNAKQLEEIKTFADTIFRDTTITKKGWIQSFVEFFQRLFGFEVKKDQAEIKALGEIKNFVEAHTKPGVKPNVSVDNPSHDGPGTQIIPTSSQITQGATPSTSRSVV